MARSLSTSRLHRQTEQLDNLVDAAFAVCHSTQKAAEASGKGPRAGRARCDWVTERQKGEHSRMRNDFEPIKYSTRSLRIQQIKIYPCCRRQSVCERVCAAKTQPVRRTHRPMWPTHTRTHTAREREMLEWRANIVSCNASRTFQPDQMPSRAHTSKKSIFMEWLCSGKAHTNGSGYILTS